MSRKRVIHRIEKLREPIVLKADQIALLKDRVDDALAALDSIEERSLRVEALMRKLSWGLCVAEGELRELSDLVDQVVDELL